jgi:hypothetical protein
VHRELEFPGPPNRLEKPRIGRRLRSSIPTRAAMRRSVRDGA